MLPNETDVRTANLALAAICTDLPEARKWTSSVSVNKVPIRSKVEVKNIASMAAEFELRYPDSDAMSDLYIFPVHAVLLSCRLCSICVRHVRQ